jgi:hypothetical protein
MNGKVMVVSDDQGNVIGVSKNNPEYGYVRLKQVVTQISETGWIKPVVRHCIIKGKVNDLVTCNFTANQSLPGKIVVKESLTSFNSENPDKDLKIAGLTGVICRVDDQPIYRQTFYTQNENAFDEFIMHTNTEEIREVQNAQREFDRITVSDKSNTKVLAEL